jgi:hypothetical protein
MADAVDEYYRAGPPGDHAERSGAGLCLGSWDLRQQAKDRHQAD